MTPQGLFGALLRALGIWFLIQAGVDAVFFTLRISEVLENLHGQVTQDKIFIAFNLAAAFLLLTLTERIIRLVYGNKI